jgi:hypothetical protein
MKPSLTDTVSWPSKRNALLLDQVPASEDPEAGPFLITSSKDVMWVERAFPGGFLRVAVRNDPPEKLFQTMVEAIASRGVESEWGNVDEATHGGMNRAIAHLHHYGFEDLECLHGKGFKVTDVIGIPATCVDWLQDGWGVLIPKDRSYVGTTYDLGDNKIGVVLHNASRGVAVLR